MDVFSVAVKITESNTKIDNYPDFLCNQQNRSAHISPCQANFPERHVKSYGGLDSSCLLSRRRCSHLTCCLFCGSGTWVSGTHPCDHVSRATNLRRRPSCGKQQDQNWVRSESYIRGGFGALDQKSGLRKLDLRASLVFFPLYSGNRLPAVYREHLSGDEITSGHKEQYCLGDVLSGPGFFKRSGADKLLDVRRALLFR